MKILFLDCETTGLNPIIHVPWEVAAVRAEHTNGGRLVLGASVDLMTWPSHAALEVATPKALEIGRFYERWEEQRGSRTARSAGEVAAAIDDLCDDRPHLVGAVPSFDDRRVGDLMRRCGITPRWHYHLIDIEALVVGYLAGTAARLDTQWTTAWNSDDLSRAIGVDPDQFDRHTAMGDVRWAIAQYAAVFGLTVEEAQR